MSNEARKGTAAAPLPGEHHDAGAESTATTIRNQLENKTMGCGCLGAIVALLFFVYAGIVHFLTDPYFAVIAAIMTGVASFVAAKTRGYHVWTGIIYLLLAITVTGLAPLFYTTLFPALAPSLPEWMRLPYVTGVLAGGGTLGLVLSFTQLKKTVSTAESLYAIQLNAASRRVDGEQVAQIVDQALVRLAACSSAGAWPAAAEFINLGDFQPHPGKSGDAILPLLGIHTVGNWGEVIPFEKQPWLNPPEVPPPIKSEKMMPRSVGTLYCNADSLCYVPLRSGLPTLEVPLTSLTGYDLRVNGFDVVSVIGDKERRYGFETIHAWRLLALISYLRVYTTEFDATSSVIWATGVREGFADVGTERFSRSSETLDAPAALQALADPDTLAGKRVERIIKDASESDRPAIRVLARDLLTAVVAVDEGDIHGWTSVMAAESLGGAIPSNHLPEGVDDLLSDVALCHYLGMESWEPLIETLGEFGPGKALLPAVVALQSGDRDTAEAAIKDLPESVRSLLLYDHIALELEDD